MAQTLVTLDQPGSIQPRTLSPDLIEAGKVFGAANGIPGALSADDYIFWYIYDNMAAERRLEAAAEYLDSGKHSARFLAALLGEDGVAKVLASRPDPARPISLLDFASGYGRVTRHIPNEVPNTEVVACDIHPSAVAFLQSIGLPAIQSAHAPDLLDLGRTFDVIFALSFLTHMPRRTWRAWLDALGRQLNPNGLLIFTAHGEVSQVEMGVGALEPDGFFFHPASEQKDLDTADYGNTVTTFEFVYSQIRESPLKLMQFKHGGAGHHDLYLLHRKIDGIRHLDALQIEIEALQVEAAEQERRMAQARADIDAFRRSRSWKLTAPMRTVGRWLQR